MLSVLADDMGHMHDTMPGHDMTGPMWMPMEPPTFSRLFTFHLQPVPLIAIGAAIIAGLYIWGVIAVRGRGIAWPVMRTVSFLAGAFLIVFVTQTGMGGYAMMSFSIHMIQHMILNMVVPIFLLLGAPITLALRALPSRSGTRKGLLRFLHSRFVQVVSNPFVTTGLFLLSLFGLYFTPALDWMMGGFIEHEIMMVHFVLVGLLFFWPIVGVDPTPKRHSHVVRIAELFFIMPFHAFFGIALMMSSTVISMTFVGPTMWGTDPLSDQYTGGAIAWAFAEIPSLFLLIAIMIQWVRSDERRAKRQDRQAERDGDAELTAYNERLQALAARHR